MKSIAILLLVVAPATAFAYIDPNAGGALFQLLTPMFAAAMGAWLFLRRWISGALRRLWRRITGHDEE